MEVILLKQVRKLGNVGEVVTVKDGFGRNFLLPQNMAIRANKENLKDIESKKVELQKKNAEAKKEAEANAKKIDDKAFVFVKQCSDDGRLFGSVAAKEIAMKVTDETKTEVSHTSIYLTHPIKNLGVYEVIISLHADVSCTVLVNVARSESESVEALAEYRAGPKEEEKSQAEIEAEKAFAAAEAQIKIAEEEAAEEVSTEVADSEEPSEE